MIYKIYKIIKWYEFVYVDYIKSITFWASFIKISRTDRLCNLCDDGVVGDEFHFILKCKALCIQRKMYIEEIYINKPSIVVMHKLFNSCDVKILSNMVKCITIINAKFA